MSRQSRGRRGRIYPNCMFNVLSPTKKSPDTRVPTSLVLVFFFHFFKFLRQNIKYCEIIVRQIIGLTFRNTYGLSHKRLVFLLTLKIVELIAYNSMCTFLFRFPQSRKANSYQLSFPKNILASVGVEPTTFALLARRSNRLS